MFFIVLLLFFVVEHLLHFLTVLVEITHRVEDGDPKQLTHLDDFGRLLDESWRLKRTTGSKISNSQIDLIYEKALQSGALGGKLLGAGGGGFMLFYVPQEKQESFRKDFSDLLPVPFRFENEGTTVIYYVPEEYEQEEAL